MPAWAVDLIVAVVSGAVITTGAGVLHYVIAIKSDVATLVARSNSNAEAIDELQSWRLNIEQARAYELLRGVTPRLRRDIP